MSTTTTPYVIDMVVAHFNEDLDWVEQIRPYVRMFIYHKGNDPDINKGFIPLTNVGREAHTYLTHIINNYDKLADVTVFVQGKISDHVSSDSDPLLFVDRLAAVALADGYSANIARIPHDTDQELRPLTVVGIKFGNETFKQSLKRVLDMDEMPAEGLFWYVGAIMCMRRDRIQSRPLEFYKMLLKEVDHDANPEQAHFFERVWYYIFKCNETDFHKRICQLLKKE